MTSPNYYSHDSYYHSDNTNNTHHTDQNHNHSSDNNNDSYHSNHPDKDHAHDDDNHNHDDHDTQTRHAVVRSTTVPFSGLFRDFAFLREKGESPIRKGFRPGWVES